MTDYSARTLAVDRHGPGGVADPNVIADDRRRTPMDRLERLMPDRTTGFCFKSIYRFADRTGHDDQRVTQRRRPGLISRQRHSHPDRLLPHNLAGRFVERE